MMLFHIKHPIRLLIHFLLFSTLFILHFTGEAIITVRSATSFLLLPMLTAYSMFNDELRSAVVGGVIGAFADAFSSTPICFNTLMLLIICASTSFISKYLFNVNFRSAIVLSVLTNALFYIAKWFVCYAFKTNLADGLVYIVDYVIPSVVINAVFVLLFFFIEKKIYSKGKIN